MRRTLGGLPEMSYGLRRKKPLGEDLHRIFRQQIDGALFVARGGAEPDDTRVHALRKHLKKARAVLQLLRSEVGRVTFRRQDRRLRDAGRLTTEIRDAEVRLQTMRQLEDAMRRHDASYRKIEQLLALELENFAAAFSGWEKAAISLLKRARRGNRKRPLARYRRKQLRRAVQRTYRSGRKAVAAVRAEPSTATAHELRKQVKLLGYQLRVLRPLNRLVIGAASDELTQLGHLLGRVHDLSFLADRLRCERGESHWGKQDEELLAVIEESQVELQENGTKMAERFFAERPSQFGARLADWIRSSPHGKAGAVAQALIAV